MARKTVASYAAFQNVGGTVSVVVYYAEGGADTIAGLGSEESEYVLDLLRNEKPVTYDAALKRLSTSTMEPVGETEAAPDLAAWLAAHPAVCSALVWESPSGALAYPGWPQSRKDALRAAFLGAWNRQPTGLADPPANLAALADNAFPTTVISEAQAWGLFAAHVGLSLAIELGQWVPWSLTGYPADQLPYLLDSREMFRWRAAQSGYEVEFSKGAATPAPPDVVFAFLGTQGLIGHDRLSTLGKLLEWSRANLIHFSGPYEAGNMEAQWQYRGLPPVSRVISGTPTTGNATIRNRTGGCWGTTGFLRALLRVLNVPARLVTAGGHAIPHFVSEGRYLTHGDDPYNALTRCTPPYPAGELLIDQARFDAWFGAGVPDAQKSNNVGRRPRELAIQHLPNYLLREHCEDLAANRPHTESEVLETLRNWTVAELEAAQLWQRMDAKIAGMGGCANVPFS
ncbi:MAG TPA: hypothetical protein VF746_20075 [Longimicrobium sp.]|jgi:hypothetical protein